MTSSSISADKEELIKEAIAALNKSRNLGLEDPMLVIFWNQERLPELAEAHPQPQQQITDFIQESGGEPQPPYPDRFFFFREPSVLNDCRTAMKRALPWAFSAGPETAAILGVPDGVPVAQCVVIYRTEKVKPDIADYDFFMLN